MHVTTSATREHVAIAVDTIVRIGWSELTGKVTISLDDIAVSFAIPARYAERVGRGLTEFVAAKSSIPNDMTIWD